MLLYELAQDCLKVKVFTITNPFAYPSFGGIGIPADSDTGKLIKHEIPNIQEKYIGFGSSCYEFDQTIQHIWAKTSEYSDLLEEILKIS